MPAMRPEHSVSKLTHVLCVLALLPFALAEWLDRRNRGR